MEYAPRSTDSGDQQTRRLFATCDIGARALGRLRDEGWEVDVYPRPEAPPKELILEKVRSGIDALISTLRDPLDAEVLAAGAGTLRIVAQDAVGYDNIDVAAASRHGIFVSNTADVLTEATAEFAFFMMGSVARKLYSSERLVREGEWTGWHPYLPFLGDELTGSTVAVLGLGRIGTAFARRCLGLGVDLLLYSRTPKVELAAALQRMLDVQFEAGLMPRRRTCRVATLDEALERGDFVSLHMPLTAEWKGLIGEAELRRMKPSAYLINTARGAVVDEEALARALKEKWIGGAALDVYQTEPLPASSPLLDPDLEERVRVFHHFGSGGRQTRLALDPDVGMAGRCVQAVFNAFDAQYAGDPAAMPYLVNPEAARR